MNIIIGFEQANRYIMMDGQGNTLGYIAERDHGMGSAFARQMFKTHRSFTTHIFDASEREVLRIHRPFAWINSKIRIYDPVPEGGYDQLETSTALQGTSASSALNQSSVAQVSPLPLEEMRVIGEAQQIWAPLRRKYDLFSYRPLTPSPENSQTPRLESGDKPATGTTALTESAPTDRALSAGMSQFAHISEPFLSWDFTLRAEDASTIGSVNRNFAGFAREIFTDTGVYALRMDSAAQSSALETAQGQEVGRYEREAAGMTLDQRAVMLAAAVSIDFDYFSRHSGAGSGGFMPLWFPGMGGGAAEGGAAGCWCGSSGRGWCRGRGAQEQEQQVRLALWARLRVLLELLDAGWGLVLERRARVPLRARGRWLGMRRCSAGRMGLEEVTMRVRRRMSRSRVAVGVLSRVLDKVLVILARMSGASRRTLGDVVDGVEMIRAHLQVLEASLERVDRAGAICSAISSRISRPAFEV